MNDPRAELAVQAYQQKQAAQIGKGRDTPTHLDGVNRNALSLGNSTESIAG
jgi:hypothetical protein